MKQIYGNDPHHTAEAIRILGLESKSHNPNFYNFNRVSTQLMSEVAKSINEENFDDAQNDAPTFKYLLNIGQEFPDVEFGGYIKIGGFDARVAIDTIFIPVCYGDTIRELRQTADEDTTTNGISRLWWD